MPLPTSQDVRAKLVDDDGALLALPTAAATGAPGDTPYADTDGSDPGSLIALLKGLWVKLNGQIIVRGAAGDSSIAVAGNANAGASDTGAPVKVGGRYNTTPPTLTNGQRGDLQLDAAAALKVSGIGTVADAAWSGTGDATVISLLKKIALNTTP